VINGSSVRESLLSKILRQVFQHDMSLTVFQRIFVACYVCYILAWQLIGDADRARMADSLAFRIGNVGAAVYSLWVLLRLPRGRSAK